LLLVVGWARAGLGDGYLLLGHHLTKSLLPIFAVYFAWQLYGGLIRRWCVHTALLLACLLLFWPNTQWGRGVAQYDWEKAAALERDLATGMPFNLFVQRNGAYLVEQEPLKPWHILLAHHCIGQLRAIGVDPFPLPEGPTHYDDAVPVPSQNERPPEGAGQAPVLAEPGKPWSPSISHSAIATDQVQWEGRVCKGNGPNAWLAFSLDRRRYVCGIRVTYAYSKSEPGEPAPFFRLDWRDNSAGDSDSDERKVVYELNDDSLSSTLTIWVYEPIDVILIFPNNRPEGMPFTFSIECLELLLREEDRPGKDTSAAQGEAR
jgi:hypothetical protein